MSALTVTVDASDGRLLVRPALLGRRRPVLSFVGIIALACLLLLGAGRSVVAAPQVSLQLTGGLPGDPTSLTSTYSVVNHGLRPVEIERVDVLGEVRVVPRRMNLHSAEVSMATRVDDLPLFAAFTIQGGGHRTLAVEIPCVTVLGPPVELVIHVRSTDLGLRDTRTEVVGEPLACP